VQGSAQHVYRRKASVARSTANYYYLLCKTDNDWTVHAERSRVADAADGSRPAGFPALL
jgi:hypothetical protein